MKKKIDWIIHLVANGAQCEECGEVEQSFKPGLCNAHTHGMNRYGHKDFQLVLRYPNEEMCRILNTLGLAVQNGAKFKDGEYINGIYEDCAIRLQSFWETDREVLRVIIPDKNNVFPYEESCEEKYKYQLLKTESLQKGCE